VSAQYQPIAQPRFAIEQTPEGEQVRVKARRQIFTLLFLPVWLTLWTIGGGVAASQMMTHLEPFLAIWLCFWALGWVMAAGTLVWMVAGSETLRIVGGDLEVAQHMFGLTRRWLYEGRQIRQLRVAEQPFWGSNFQWQVPFLRLGRSGSVKFDYGARTVPVAPGLDAAEGRMIVDRLMKRLPASASG
jgi:hypothetical protein